MFQIVKFYIKKAFMDFVTCRRNEGYDALATFHIPATDIQPLYTLDIVDSKFSLKTKQNTIQIINPKKTSESESSLRQRKITHESKTILSVKEIVEKNKVLDTKGTVLDAKVEKKLQQNDPLYWYGLLVPQELRNAQQKFSKGLKKRKC
jgi:hypothetical protein